MVYVILGFLMIRALTQYDLKQALSREVSPFYSPSLGSIQAALKKLEAAGYVVPETQADGRRKKKLYTITASGREALRAWMLASIAQDRLETDVGTKLFFLGLMAPAERLAIIRDIVQQLELVAALYEQTELAESARSVDTPYRDIARYQLKTLSLGLLQHRSMLEGLRQVLTELEEEIYGGES
ncbi:helix-turn-helix transcriptional regulator [Paenibacillus sp. 1P07SE]|uniref:helix-turn-helix transcriptional regulator n=1 Tax=Paenibacillus sp. 1P07SE TaxID=3132209 RepID=UPI0039A66FB7